MTQLSIFALVIFVLSTTGVLASSPKSLGVFGKWSTWSYSDNSGNHCFIYSSPISKEPASLNHGDVSFFIRAARQTEARSEASLQTGYALAGNADILVSVGAQPFHMISSGNGAWLRRTGIPGNTRSGSATFSAPARSGMRFTMRSPAASCRRER